MQATQSEFFDLADSQINHSGGERSQTMIVRDDDASNSNISAPATGSHNATKTSVQHKNVAAMVNTSALQSPKSANAPTQFMMIQDDQTVVSSSGIGGGNGLAS